MRRATGGDSMTTAGIPSLRHRSGRASSAGRARSDRSTSSGATTGRRASTLGGRRAATACRACDVSRGDTSSIGGRGTGRACGVACPSRSMPRSPDRWAASDGTCASTPGRRAPSPSHASKWRPAPISCCRPPIRSRWAMSPSTHTPPSGASRRPTSRARRPFGVWARWRRCAARRAMRSTSSAAYSPSASPRHSRKPRDTQIGPSPKRCSLRLLPPGSPSPASRGIRGSSCRRRARRRPPTPTSVRGSRQPTPSLPRAWRGGHRPRTISAAPAELMGTSTKAVSAQMAVRRPPWRTTLCHPRPPRLRPHRRPRCPHRPPPLWCRRPRRRRRSRHLRASRRRALAGRHRSRHVHPRPPHRPMPRPRRHCRRGRRHRHRLRRHSPASAGVVLSSRRATAKSASASCAISAWTGGCPASRIACT